MSYQIIYQTAYREKKPFFTKITKTPIRFVSKEKEIEKSGLTPSPSTYQIMEAYNAANSPKGSLIIGKARK